MQNKKSFQLYTSNSKVWKFWLENQMFISRRMIGIFEAKKFKRNHVNNA